MNDAPLLTALAMRAKASWGYPASWVHQWTADLTITPELIASQHVLVAERNGAIAGMVALMDVEGAFTIEHLWIAPEHQRKGVGRRLVSAVLAQAKARGASSLTVEADPNAAMFYEALGGRRSGSSSAPMPGAPDRVLPVFTFDLEK